jgi:heme/copper-type cytochrome/quinol oxidase subunit 2
MYKNVLQSIGGVEVYAIISLLLFVIVFVGMLIIVMRMRKSTIDKMASLPLEGNDGINPFERR